jgi:hypothetical protein
MRATRIQAYMHTRLQSLLRKREAYYISACVSADTNTRLYAYMLKCSHAYLLTRVRTSTRRRRQEDAAMCMRAYALRLSRSARNRTSLIPASSHEHAEARSACTLQRARAFGYHACTISRRAGRTKRVVADALTPSSCGA